MLPPLPLLWQGSVDAVRAPPRFPPEPERPNRARRRWLVSTQLVQTRRGRTIQLRPRGCRPSSTQDAQQGPRAAADSQPRERLQRPVLRILRPYGSHLITYLRPLRHPLSCWPCCISVRLSSDGSPRRTSRLSDTSLTLLALDHFSQLTLKRYCLCKPEVKEKACRREAWVPAMGTLPLNSENGSPTES